MKHRITGHRARAGAVLLATCALAACSSIFHKQGQIRQYTSPDVDATRFKTLTVISDGADKFDLQIMGRVRDRISNAGVTVVKRAGRWENDRQALQDICTQRPGAEDNVDGIVFVRWDRVTLHDCGTGKIATDINGGYNGTDAMTERLLQYLGAQSKARS